MSAEAIPRDLQPEEPADQALDFLLSPSEWRVVLALYSVQPPASSSAVAQAMLPQKLPKKTVDALLERLHARGLISRAQHGGWKPGGTSIQELLRPQIEAFLRTYLVGVPQGFDLLRKVVEEWQSRT